MSKYRILLLIILILCSTTKLTAQYEDVIVISDLDDTYKVTNTKFKPFTIWNALFTRNAFSGMTELYSIIGSKCNKFCILSSSPEIIRGRVRKLLKKHKLNVDTIILRPFGMRGKIYKYETIAKILQANPTNNFILLGDDSGHDHNVYVQLAEKFKNQIIAIYIRPVKYKKIALGVTRYFSAFDIAWHEYNAHRFTEPEALDVASKILNCKRRKLILPHYLEIKQEQTINHGKVLNQNLLVKKIAIFEKLRKINEK